MAGMNGLVLYYCPQGAQEAAKARLVFIRSKLRVKLLTEADLNELIGPYVGLKARPAEELPEGWEQVEPTSFMVFAGLRGHVLDKVLSDLVKSGVPRSVYKAVVTPTNAGWTFRALYTELTREREAMAQGKQD